MNAATATAEIRTALASAARSFQPRRRPRFAKLAGFEVEISELRGRGASFETIAHLLREHSVQISHETVRRFYREIIEQKPVRRKRRRMSRNAQAISPVRPRSLRQSAKDIQVQAGTKVTRPTERGPRIARIEDL